MERFTRTQKAAAAAVAFLVLVGIGLVIRLARTSPETREAAGTTSTSQSATTIAAEGSATTAPSTTTSATSVTSATSTSTTQVAQPADAEPVVSISDVILERTESCPPFTIAPGVNISAGVAGDMKAFEVSPTQRQLEEGSAVVVFDGFTESLGDGWTVNLNFLEHSGGAMLNRVHDAPTVVSETLSGPDRATISYSISDAGGTVTMNPIRLEIPADCHQVAPEVTVTFIDRVGPDGEATEVSSGSTNIQTVELARDQQLVVLPSHEFPFEGDNWEISVRVFDHDSGRLFTASHQAAGSTSEVMPTVSADNLEYRVKYSIKQTG